MSRESRDRYHQQCHHPSQRLSQNVAPRFLKLQRRVFSSDVADDSEQGGEERHDHEHVEGDGRNVLIDASPAIGHFCGWLHARSVSEVEDKHCDVPDRNERERAPNEAG